MVWSKWYPLLEESIEENAPQEGGIYRIALKDEFCFTLINGEWYGVFQGNRKLLNCFKDKDPYRVCPCKTEYGKSVCTDLVYIGKTDNLKRRLKEHLKDPQKGNPCIQKLLNKGYPLFFSFLRRISPSFAEQRVFQEFIKASGGFCPPCDGGSNECQREGGKVTPAYLIIGNKRMRLK